MGGLLAIFRGKPPETPVKGWGPRLKNIFKHHFRGILGVLVPLIILSWQLRIKKADETSIHVWIWMACFYLLQPVSIPVTGSIPLFAFPMLGISSTANIVKCYFNEGITLFIVGGMLHLLLNNSGFDRRFALYMLCKGAASSFSPVILLCKCSFVAFFLSMFCHRLIVASTLIQYVTPVLMDLQAATAKYRATEPEFNKIKNVINNAIQTSCSIGGIAIMHSSYCTLAYRAIYLGCVLKDEAYPDFLNYAQYTGFALPISVALFLINLLYHFILLKWFGGKKITTARMTEIRTTVLKYKSKIPLKITNHEKLAIFFCAFAISMFFGRYIEATQKGWAEYSKDKGIPRVKDATVAAMFVIALHIFPRSSTMFKLLKTKKKSQLPPTKPDSAILFWRFVDKNTNYGYFFVIGAGIALWLGVQTSRVVNKTKYTGATIINQKFEFLTNLDFCVAILIICLVSVALTNMISGVAAVSIWLPLVLILKHEKKSDSPWVTKMHLPALAVGICSSFGFISPFLYTPAYFCHHTGKVPKMVMLKYSLIPCIISAVIIFVSVCYYAPVIFGEKVEIISIAKVIVTTTVAPTTGAAAPED